MAIPRSPIANQYVCRACHLGRTHIRRRPLIHTYCDRNPNYHHESCGCTYLAQYGKGRVRTTVPLVMCKDHHG